MSKSRFSIYLLVCLLFLGSCFGGMEKRGSVRAYYNGVVQTEGGSFRIGKLPNYWKLKKTKFRALVFVNKEDASTITIDSFCKSAVDGGSLQDLTGKLFHGIGDFKITDQHTQLLANRTVLKTEAQGKVDGARLFLSAYVMRMNECVFDFIYVNTPDDLESYTDFKSMVKGFAYVDGPDAL